MLVLSRKIGESVIIDDNIKIKIVSKRGGQIRFGIEAPKSILVYREEVYKKLLDAKKAANTEEA